MKQLKKVPVLWIVLIGVLLSGSVIGYSVFKKGHSSSKTEMTEATVGREDLMVSVSADGTAYRDTTNLDFEVSGKLTAVYVKQGDVVKKGQALAKIDDADYMDKVKSAQVAYQKAQAEYASSIQSNKLSNMEESRKLQDYKTQLETAALQYEPIANLTDAYSAQEIELKKQAYNTAKLNYQTQQARYASVIKDNSSVTLAKANLDSAKVNLETAQRQLSLTVLTAPADLKIINVGYRAGEYVVSASQNSSNTNDSEHMMVGVSADEIKAVVPVPETDLGQVSLNQDAEVTFEALNGKVIQGKVVDIKNVPETDSNGIVTYDTTILLTSPPDSLRTGMTCTANMIVKQKKDVLTVPNKAVKMQDGKQTVQLKSSDGKWQTTTVKIGFTNGKSAEVTSGLKEGDVVGYMDTATESSSTSKSKSNQNSGPPGGMM